MLPKIRQQKTLDCGNLYNVLCEFIQCFQRENRPLAVGFSGKYGIPFGTLTKQVSQGKWLDEGINIGSDTGQKSIEFSVNNYICPDTKMGL